MWTPYQIRIILHHHTTRSEFPENHTKLFSETITRFIDEGLLQRDGEGLVVTTERVRLFDLHGGACHICGHKIKIGEVWELEHLVAWELTRDDSDGNVKPAHKDCHKEKTAVDVANIRKADRIRAKHIGAWPQSKAKIKSAGFRKSRDT